MTEQLIRKVKQIRGARWNPEKKHWHMPYEYRIFKQIESSFGKDQLLIDSSICWTVSKSIQGALDALERQLVLERKAYATIKAYKFHFKTVFDSLFWHYPTKYYRGSNQKPISIYLFARKEYRRVLKIRLSMRSKLITKKY